MATKEEYLALTSGLGLAGVAVENFYRQYTMGFLYEYKTEIIESIIKPNKTTAVHYYLAYLQYWWKGKRNIFEDLDDLSEGYDIIYRLLVDVDRVPSISVPNFNECGDVEGHFECKCKSKIDKWIEYYEDNLDEINELIIHSAFQFIFQDRKFLHDFHIELADFIKCEIEDIKEVYPEFVTSKNRLKRRQYFPSWLKSAVFYRDKGTCTICRCDLSNLIRNQNQIHIDHIVPLNIFGSNDATNLQLLCEKCNTKKGDRNTITSSVNVPFWNQ
ncbi:HNH endonuclease [Peribacillus sp. NPDC076916]|uniref:HNH endonuclease n=1 Tax=Peribacillus sp. NPDC076916 TaxID=3390608 RepID=UPI003CFFA8D8